MSSFPLISLLSNRPQWCILNKTIILPDKNNSFFFVCFLMFHGINCFGGPTLTSRVSGSLVPVFSAGSLQQVRPIFGNIPHQWRWNWTACAQNWGTSTIRLHSQQQLFPSLCLIMFTFSNRWLKTTSILCGSPSKCLSYRCAAAMRSESSR